MSRYVTAMCQGNKIHISQAERGSHDYTCCFCGDPMIAKKGKVKAHHFAHKSDYSCDEWYGNKGLWHIYMQNLFPIEQQEVIKVVDDEKHIADVCIPKPSGNNLIIEFQDSPMSYLEFNRRTNFWKKNGDDIVWVFNVTNRDIRQVPMWEGYYRWYRPFSTLGDCYIENVPIIFYMNPDVSTRWVCSGYNDYMHYYTYNIGDGIKPYAPLYFINKKFRSIPLYDDDKWHYQIKKLNEDKKGYNLLYSDDIRRSDEEFLRYINDRLLVTDIDPFIKYRADYTIVLNFFSKEDFIRQFEKLKSIQRIGYELNRKTYSGVYVDVAVYFGYRSGFHLAKYDTLVDIYTDFLEFSEHYTERFMRTELSSVYIYTCGNTCGIL